MSNQLLQFSVSDQITGWNNPNKTKKQKELLSFRGTLLNARMKYPLSLKLRMTRSRINAVIDEYGEENCYIGFSGGKDSTILSHIILSMGYKIEHVFSNTRLEYPECIDFARKWCKKNKVKLTMVLPEKKPEEIWKKYGYPMFSKEIAEYLERARHGYNLPPRHLKKIKGFIKRLGYRGNFEDKEKLKNFFKYRGIKISAKCCNYLKKEPMKKWAEQSGKKVAILGTRAEESQIRRVVWVRKGCVYQRGTKEVIVNPIIIFTEKDIKDYAKKHKIRFAKIYYQGMKRNGCYACGFGCHLAEENNFQKLKKRNPVLWKNVTNHWGFGKICKKCKVKIE